MVLPSFERFLNRYLVVAVLFFVFSFSTVCAFKFEHKGSLGGDAKPYVLSAYHLAKNNTFSFSKERDNPTPGCRRAPGYPIFLAGLMSVFPQFLDDDFNWLFPPQGTPVSTAPSLLVIKYTQAGLLLATAFMIAWMVWDYTQKRIPAYVTLWLIGFHPFLERYVHRLYREVFASFLIAAFALLIYLALTRKRIIYYVLGGLVLGFLTLTMSQWVYVGAAGIIALAFCVIMQRANVVRALTGVALLTIAWLAVFYPWELRNEQLFGHKIIGAGGGVVLEIRSQYNMIPLSTYASSFAYWSRSPLLKKGLLTFVDQKNYVQLIRYEEEGAYYKAKVKFSELAAEFGVAEADRLLKEEAIQRIKEHPVRHLLLCIPITFRLMMNPMFSILWIGVYALFGFAVYFALRKRAWSLLAVLAFPSALFCFNTLVSHGLTRYNGQAAPLLIFGAVVGVHAYRTRTIE